MLSGNEQFLVRNLEAEVVFVIKDKIPIFCMIVWD